MLVVRLTGTGQEGSTAKPTENFIAWQFISESRQIIAVGGPSDWASAEPLPADAVLVDLIRASVGDPDQAREFWCRFLAYVDFKENGGALHGLKRLFVAIPVRVDIADATVRQAVVSAIEGSKGCRINLQGS